MAMNRKERRANKKRKPVSRMPPPKPPTYKVPCQVHGETTWMRLEADQDELFFCSKCIMDKLQENFTSYKRDELVRVKVGE